MKKNAACSRKEWGNFIETPHYAALDRDGKLLALLRELGRYTRFHIGAKSGQAQALRFLLCEGEMTQRALTERLRIQPGSASELLGKMEDAGLILRSPHAEDRRTALVRLTDVGRAEAEALKRAWTAQLHMTFSTLTEAEGAELLTLLEKLYRDLKTREGGEHDVEIH